MPRDRHYFAADLHLGAPDAASSLEREKRFVRWLEHIRPTARTLYLLGDVFDFWFEYRRVVPKGYIRLLGKLAELSDDGIALHLFAGNHDLWYRDYLPQQMNIQIHFAPQVVELHGQLYFLAHGDGLGPGDHGYKLLKRFLRSPLTRWLFARLHPNLGMGLALHFSTTSRKAGPDFSVVDLGEREYLRQFARAERLQQPAIDCFVFGHRHLLKDEALPEGGRLIILGDWLRHFSYLEVGPEGANLHRFTG
jgi:UDP-2,3-diacylglucosamine hydrolase